MQTEIESKFLDVNHEEIRSKLKSLGSECVCKERLMRRKNFDFPDRRLENDRNGWVRVRDEGDKATLAYKQLDNRDLDGTKEVSVTVSNFDDTCRLLESIGLKVKSYQETKRESWVLDGAEIELDEWPWAKPFIEIEANTEEVMFETIKKLGLEKSDAVHGSVEIVYTSEFDVTDEDVDSWEEIVFVSIPEWLEKRRK